MTFPASYATPFALDSSSQTYSDTTLLAVPDILADDDGASTTATSYACLWLHTQGFPGCEAGFFHIVCGCKEPIRIR